MGFFSRLFGGKDKDATPESNYPTPPTLEESYLEMGRSLDSLYNTIKDLTNPLPTVMYTKIEEVTNIIVDRIIPLMIEKTRDGSGVPTGDFYTVHSAATEYLPHTVREYLKIRNNHEDNKPLYQGQTASELALSQLDSIYKGMNRILSSLRFGQARGLIEHSHFLDSKFPESRNDLNLRPYPSDAA